ncbi:MAG: tyrosine-type recombinase/integrase [Nitrososphaerota archaeon]|jgi:integrase|nr:tyrosine-type recombinase/integrase [Nitrososphaerota archaeon]MDG6929771.1 tyrosine-type recombinase/integrase [Nitrososphaerota archaeon]
MTEISTRENAIKWVEGRISLWLKDNPKYMEGDLWKYNLEAIKEYFQSTEKTGLTIKNYGTVYSRFLYPFLMENNLKAENLDEDAIGKLVKRLGQYRPETVDEFVTRILAVVNWQRGRMKMPSIKSKYIIMPKGEAKSRLGTIEDRLTDDDVRRVIAAIKKPEMQLAVLMMSRLGLRVSEVLGIRWSDLFRDQEIGSAVKLVYRAGEYGPKGPKAERIVPVTEDVRAAIKTLSIAKGITAGDMENRIIPYTKRAVLKAVKNAGRAAGLSYTLHPHLFRHHFIAMAPSHGLDIDDVSKITGDNPQTINRYYIKKSLKKTADKMHSI